MLPAQLLKGRPVLPLMGASLNSPPPRCSSCRVRPRPPLPRGSRAWVLLLADPASLLLSVGQEGLLWYQDRVPSSLPCPSSVSPPFPQVILCAKVAAGAPASASQGMAVQPWEILTSDIMSTMECHMRKRWVSNHQRPTVLGTCFLSPHTHTSKGLKEHPQLFMEPSQVISHFLLCSFKMILTNMLLKNLCRNSSEGHPPSWLSSGLFHPVANERVEVGRTERGEPSAPRRRGAGRREIQVTHTLACWGCFPATSVASLLPSLQARLNLPLERFP